MKTCPHCRMEVPTTANKCPYCLENPSTGFEIIETAIGLFIYLLIGWFLIEVIF